jgi:hypothetical protein
MPGSFDLNAQSTPLSMPALLVVVAAYYPASNQYFPLPNVWCDRIDEKWGPFPAVARFRYLTDDLLETTNQWPSQYEDLWPIDAQGDYVVHTDDRLVVATLAPDGTQTILFDGYAQIPQIDVASDQQAVTFQAVSVAMRLWDQPITGRVERDADNASDTTGEFDWFIEDHCRFNPADTTIGALGGYLANCVATADYTVDDTLGQYPVFLDPLCVERGELDVSFWYVSDATMYLIEEMINLWGWDEYIKFPTLASIPDIISSMEPPPDDPFLNPADAVSADIKIRDYDATNKPYVEVMSDLLRYAGFMLRFDVGSDENGDPQTSLVISRRDNLSTVAPKQLWHAESSQNPLDPNQNNIPAYTMTRDLNMIANEWVVESARRQVEACFYLVPLFSPIANVDAASGVDLSVYHLSKLTNADAEHRKAYRWFGIDECGDGYYNMETQTNVVDKGCDLSIIFPTDTAGNTTYARRYRPGQRTLISRDDTNKPRIALLEVAFGVNSSTPGPLEEADDGNTWYAIAHGWHLLKDRFGIAVTVENVQQWDTQNNDMPNGPRINIPTQMQHPLPAWMAAAKVNFALRLTTVVFHDRRIDIRAAKRPASPTVFPRVRSIDAADHFQHCSVHPSSPYYEQQGGDGTDPLVIRDDTQDAATHANQLRTAHEFPPVAGKVAIPYLTDYYKIGDRINFIAGRNVNLQSNIGVDQGEAPSYPWIVARSYIFGDARQVTELQLSDERAVGRNL